MEKHRTQRERAREELRRRAEGALALSIGEALDYLGSADAADLAGQAGIDAGRSARDVLHELTGVRAG